MGLGRLRPGVASGCEPIGPGYQAAFDGLGGEDDRILLVWGRQGLQRQSFR